VPREAADGSSIIGRLGACWFIELYSSRFVSKLVRKVFTKRNLDSTIAVLLGHCPRGDHALYGHGSGALGVANEEFCCHHRGAGLAHRPSPGRAGCPISAAGFPIIVFRLPPCGDPLWREMEALGRGSSIFSTTLNTAANKRLSCLQFGALICGINEHELHGQSTGRVICNWRWCRPRLE